MRVIECKFYIGQVAGNAYLIGSNGFLASFVKLFDGLLIVAQIFLATNEDNRKPLAEMEDLRNPLHVVHVSASPYHSGYFSLSQCMGKTYLLLNVIERVW